MRMKKMKKNRKVEFTVLLKVKSSFYYYYYYYYFYSSVLLSMFLFVSLLCKRIKIKIMLEMVMCWKRYSGTERERERKMKCSGKKSTEKRINLNNVLPCCYRCKMKKKQQIIILKFKDRTQLGWWCIDFKKEKKNSPIHS